MKLRVSPTSNRPDGGITMTDPTGQEARQYERKDASVECELIIREIRLPCRATDVSAGGVRLLLDVPPGLPTGVAVVIDIKPYGEFDAEVVWMGKGEIGLRFDADSMMMIEVLEAMAMHGLG